LRLEYEWAEKKGHIARSPVLVHAVRLREGAQHPVAGRHQLTPVRLELHMAYPVAPRRRLNLALSLQPSSGPGHDDRVSARRTVLIATAAVVAVLGVLLVALRWDSANKLAVVVSALATVAAVGVAVWAGLPAVSGKPAMSGRRVRVSRTGRATAGPGGRANTGFSGPASAQPDELLVDRTGDADASNGGDANSGAQLN
jgi:hypothetical protein